MEVLAIITALIWFSILALMLSNEKNKEAQEQQNEINK
jgi:hypothetical protein